MNIREKTQAEMKLVGKKLLNGINESYGTDGVVYFNENNFPSDTKGSLKGTVYYVQNSTIPAHDHIAHDVQPHIVANRKLMVLFKPDNDGLENIFLNIKDSKGRIIETKTLIFDSSKIPLCGQKNINNKLEFNPPEKFDITYTSDADLRALSNNPKMFEDVFLVNQSVKIETSDGSYAPSFTLPTGLEFSGKMILFVCNSGYDFDVIRSGMHNIRLSRGQEVLFINYDGEWFHYEDVEYSMIKYMENVWHVSISAANVFPGLRLEFFTNTEKGSVDNITVGASSQLLLHTISIGMLTPYLESFHFQENPEYHRQYFQQIPLSQLIVSTYDPIYLKEVMLPDGRLLTSHAPGNGGWHEGVMREDTAKDLIAKGINYANYGYLYSGVRRDELLPTAQISIHISVGKYDNGVQIHGGSGGAGMATLDSTIGNEFSHEIGHNYGLGHFPGGFYGSVDQVASERNSSWGWDSDNNYFLPNFEQTITNKRTYLDDGDNEKTLFVAPFYGHSFGKDAMAGGSPMYPEYNVFTLHTPYVLSRIQDFLETKAVFNPSSPTGYSIWDNQTQSMKPYKLINYRTVFSSVPVTNAVDITADVFTQYFDKKINTLVESWDGHYPPYVYLPDASERNKGLIAKFDVNSGYIVDVHVNGEFDRLRKGTVRSYYSNGSSWVTVDSSSDTMAIAPYKQGVKVITLVGYYDPENEMTSYIYPGLNGSWGNVYQYDMASVCYLEVECTSGQKINFPLSNERIVSSSMNKFHINIERDLYPSVVRIYNKGELLAQRKLDLGSDELSYSVNGAQLINDC